MTFVKLHRGTPEQFRGRSITHESEENTVDAFWRATLSRSLGNKEMLSFWEEDRPFNFVKLKEDWNYFCGFRGVSIFRFDTADQLSEHILEERRKRAPRMAKYAPIAQEKSPFLGAFRFAFMLRFRRGAGKVQPGRAAVGHRNFFKSDEFDCDAHVNLCGDPIELPR